MGILPFLDGWSDRNIYVFMIVSIHVAVTLSHFAFIRCCDQFGWFKKYKLYEYSHDSKLFFRCVLEAVVKYLIIQPVAAYYLYPLMEYFGTTMTGPTPSAAIIARDLLVSLVILDTMFYWVHRGLHHKAIYKHVHKQHHEFKVNVLLNAEFAHPIEDAFSSLLPFLVGPLLLGSHGVTIAIWLTWRLFETQDAHGMNVFDLIFYL